MKRLLFISHRVPYPPDKGERVRAFHALRALSARFGVTLAALAHRRSDYAAAAALRPWCERVIVAPAGGAMGLLRGGLALLGGRSVTEGFFHSPTMKHLLARECRRDRFDLVLGYCSSTLPLALAVPAAARVMDLVDIDSLKWRSYAAGARWPASWLYRAESGRLRAMERRAVETCQAALCVSEAEAGACSFGDRKLTVVENGVDADYFKPSPAGAASSRGVVFTGTMSYRPNVDAVVWFAGEVWPGLVREIPDLTFAIVGRGRCGAWAGAPACGWWGRCPTFGRTWTRRRWPRPRCESPAACRTRCWRPWPCKSRWWPRRRPWRASTSKTAGTCCGRRRRANGGSGSCN